MTGVSSDLLAPDAVFTWAQAVQSTYALEAVLLYPLLLNLRMQLQQIGLPPQ